MGEKPFREGNWECWGTEKVGLQNGVCSTDQVNVEQTRRCRSKSCRNVVGRDLRDSDTCVTGTVCMGGGGACWMLEQMRTAF